MRKELRRDYDPTDPESVDKYARRLVSLSKLDDEGCYQTPNDFEECVQLVKDKILLPNPGGSDFDYELDDLIFRRGLLQFELKYGLKWHVPDELLQNQRGEEK